MSMSDALDGGREGETVELTVEQVLDPEDYLQNQRLKDIHDARREVRVAVKNLVRGRCELSEFSAANNRLARAVAFYGAELEPMMIETGWSHDFEWSEDSPGEPVKSVSWFIGMVGTYSQGSEKGTPVFVSMRVFRELNQFAREVGLGTQLGGDEADEAEMDYSDLL